MQITLTSQAFEISPCMVFSLLRNNIVFQDLGTAMQHMANAIQAAEKTKRKSATKQILRV